MKDRSAIVIQETVQIYKAIIPYQIGVHALSACDTVGCYYAIGKGRVVKLLPDGYFFQVWATQSKRNAVTRNRRNQNQITVLKV